MAGEVLRELAHPGARLGARMVVCDYWHPSIRDLQNWLAC